MELHYEVNQSNLVEYMKAPVVRYNRKDQPEFVKELRRNVNLYFEKKNISKHANMNMVFKTIFMVFLYFTPLILMLTGVVHSVWTVMLLWVIMSLGMSGIGLSIMHDANHGSYSKNKRVNNFLGFLVNFIGGYHVNWRIQHNVLHHSYTNVHEHDEDLINPVMRFSPEQEQKKMFKYQAFYAPFFYGIMTIYWALTKDFVDVLRYDKKDLLKAQGLTVRKALAEIAFHKTWYFILTLVLPIIMLPIAWWQTLLGFLLMHFICGIILALIFQPAHVIEETHFFSTCPKGSLENNWAIHQLKTTANFANKSVFFSWFIGGLNFQIEHHLFPNICHVHYKGISKIVKETAQKFNIPYYEHETFFGALKSHFTLLHQLGTGKYDKMVAQG